jgi:hypothetical protein
MSQLGRPLHVNHLSRGPSPKSLRFAGKGVRVFEQEDGRVEIRCEGQVLPCSPFDKNRCVDEGAVVQNRRPGGSARRARCSSGTRRSRTPP